MAISEFEIKRIEKTVEEFVENRRPELHLRYQVDLAFRIDNQRVIIFEIRELWSRPNEKDRIPEGISRNMSKQLPRGTFPGATKKTLT